MRKKSSKTELVKMLLNFSQGMNTALKPGKFFVKFQGKNLSKSINDSISKSRITVNLSTTQCYDQ